MECTTYSLYDPAGTKIVNNVAMSELASTSGVYYATFNYATLGAYTIVLCDNTTAHLNVLDRTTSDPLFSYADDILNQVNVLNSTVININATIENINGTLLDNLNATLNNQLSTISTESNNSNQIYIFLFIFALAFVIIGYIAEDNYIKAISGMIFCAIAVYIFRYGFYNLNNQFIQYAVSIICLGIGFYLLIKSVLIILEESFK
jgi:RsiW-degrading membrane proteinase PrsW (M82 family)